MLSGDIPFCSSFSITATLFFTAPPYCSLPAREPSLAAVKPVAASPYCNAQTDTPKALSSFLKAFDNEFTAAFEAE